MGGQGTVEKVWKCLTEENKDVRKGSWTNKEVRPLVLRPPLPSHFLVPFLPRFR